MIAAQHLRELRLEKNYSQEAMAIALNIGQKTYSNLENGKSRIHLEQVLKLSEVFKIHPVELTKKLFSIDDEVIRDIKTEQKQITEKEIYQGVNEGFPFELLQVYRERVEELKKTVQLQAKRIKDLEQNL